MRVTTDPTRCIAAGNCVRHAPSVYDQDEEEGTVVLLTDEVSPDDLEAVRRAVDACPSGAIGLVEG